MNSNTTLLVFSAHAADFVWRGGGTIAKYIKHGANVHLVVMSYGIRGESNDLWKIKDQTKDQVRKTRKQEMEKAAGILGVKNLEQWDWDDYHMYIDDERLYRMVKKIRQVRPDHILTHSEGDAFNIDHGLVSQKVFEASVLANSAGVQLEGLKHTKQQRIFGFEPHQSEISGFMPDALIDITETYDQKRQAMESFQAQNHLIEYYSDRAFMRGNHARRCSGIQDYSYAEAFTRRFPYVGGEFV